MLKFKTSCAVLAYLSSNLLNDVGLSLFRYFDVGLRVCDIVVKKFTFAISSPDEFLYFFLPDCLHGLLPGPFLLSSSVFVFSLFFVSVQCARLGWPSRQLLSTRASIPCRTHANTGDGLKNLALLVFSIVIVPGRTNSDFLCWRAACRIARPNNMYCSVIPHFLVV